MTYRTLGRTDTKISAVGLGCMGFTHAYGTPCDENEAARTIALAADAGCTFFDTAECYTGTRADGSTAYNEELVGAALKPYRNRVVIASKFGVHHAGDRSLILDSRPESIRAAVEGSLRRLGTDRIDLYYQHRVDPRVPVEDVAGVMAELIKAGKILSWGISEADAETVRRAHAVCPLTAVQNRYSMMARWHGSLFPVLEELGITYVAFSPLANGILSGGVKKGEAFAEGDYRSFMPQYTDEAFEQNRALLDLVRSLAQEKGATPAQISLAWMLNKKPFIVPIPGSRRAERIQENLGAADIVLAADEVAAIDARLDGMEMSAVFGGNRTT